MKQPVDSPVKKAIKKPVRKAVTKTESRYDCDVAVVGCGSGGFGAALAAARLGLDVVLVEKASSLGGI
ncbi:MAG: FAD-dependent oxidoreductase [Kiritimatiellae bacterium]|nr:FAD-dependent oxidoreductase [Kiritimatiellia bacterium]